ncbi:hypothetical protein [Paenibacillus sp. AR247]|uniref:hypothetical protein n=1 Tax=Paenibacillus sp. AR247 TaxID=1631599 RepID=UPI001C614F83|nr:hypothetical protein [Paenibacillus sp. AR247]
MRKINAVKQEVAAACPDYESQIKALITEFESYSDIPEANIPEDISELLFETFSDVQAEASDDGEDNANEEAGENFELEDLVARAEENFESLRRELLREKSKLDDMSSALEAISNKAQQEIEIISSSWTGTKKELNAELKPIKERLKAELATLKEEQKEKSKGIKAKIKVLERAIPEAEYELKKLTNKGKLELMLSDNERIATLKERWIDAEVAKELDYPIFMAVSDRGGKNNSGDYQYLIDEDGNLIEYDDGQPIIDQDLVNFSLGPEELNEINTLEENQICIAESFIKFAQKHGFDFWRVN